jgi:hypothetical protein
MVEHNFVVNTEKMFLATQQFIAGFSVENGKIKTTNFMLWFAAPPKKLLSKMFYINDELHAHKILPNN